MNLMGVLEEFMLIEGISGYENKIADAFKKHVECFADEIQIDKAGNVIAKFTGIEQNTQKIMIYAHMDSLGFIVRKIENCGLLQIDRLGGIPEKVLPGLNVSVRTIDGNYVPGVIAVKAHHITPPEDKYKVDLVTNLFIDIGASNKQEVLDIGIRIGCPIVYKPYFTRLFGTRIAGTTADNRGGCAALIGIAEYLHTNRPKSDVYLVGTVWEEYNLRGAMLAARKIRPDFAICLDVVLAGDTPELATKFDVELGGGPAVVLYNFHGRGTLNGTIAHNGLYKLALKCAKEKNIPLQEFSALGMLTDNAYVQFENEYVACLDMGFATRYTHSPVESMDVKDIEDLAVLVAYMACTIDKDLSPHRF